MKLVRTLRVLKRVHELYLIFNGFAGAMQTMLWGFLLLAFILTMFSIVTVQVVHPIALKIDSADMDDYCRLAFSSIWRAYLFYFQTTVAGDAWGQCVMPLLEHAPLLYLVFAFVLFGVQIGFMNLILTVVVERAADARELDHEHNLAMKEDDEYRTEVMLYNFCKTLDTNQNGEITLEELLGAYDEDFGLCNHFKVLHFRKSDIENLFHLVDKDDSGTLSYSEMIDCLHHIRTGDTNTQIMTMRMEMDKWFKSVTREVGDVVKQEVARSLAALKPSAFQSAVPRASPPTEFCQSDQKAGNDLEVTHTTTPPCIALASESTSGGSHAVNSCEDGTVAGNHHEQILHSAWEPFEMRLVRLATHVVEEVNDVLALLPCEANFFSPGDCKNVHRINNAELQPLPSCVSNPALPFRPRWHGCLVADWQWADAFEDLSLPKRVLGVSNAPEDMHTAPGPASKPPVCLHYEWT